METLYFIISTIVSVFITLLITSYFKDYPEKLSDIRRAIALFIVFLFRFWGAMISKGKRALLKHHLAQHPTESKQIDNAMMFYFWKVLKPCLIFYAPLSLAILALLNQDTLKISIGLMLCICVGFSLIAIITFRWAEKDMITTN